MIVIPNAGTAMRALALATSLLLLAACNSAGTSVQALQSVALEDVARTGHTRHLKYGDHDAVAIKGRQPREFPVHGIDLSRHNKAIDWSTVKRSGIDFAFIKASEGGNDGDRRFAELWSAARAAGVPRSAYHFYYFCASPEKQARNYIAHNRLLLPGEFARLEVYVGDWNRQVGL